MFNIFHIVVYFCLCIIVRTNGESLATSNEEDRIVGGQPARPNSIPWQIIIEKQKSNGNFIFWGCSGSIINSKFILTAGHCADSGDIWILAGAHDRSDKSEKQRQRLKVIKKIVYPGFNNTEKTHDIALLKVESPGFDLSKSEVRAANLPSKDFKPADLPCAVSGWGRTKPKGTQSDSSQTLMMVKIPILSHEVCLQLWHKYMSKGHKICASSQGKASCQGDSGGPLMCRGSKEVLLTGIVSFGSKYCGTGKPGVFTEVTHYVDWIKKNTF